MSFEDPSPELMEKAKACKTADELLALAEAEGYELSSKELAAVTGGADWWDECDCDGSGYQPSEKCSGYRPFLP